MSVACLARLLSQRWDVRLDRRNCQPDVVVVSLAALVLPRREDLVSSPLRLGLGKWHHLWRQVERQEEEEQEEEAVG